MSYKENKRWRLTHCKGRNLQRRKYYQKTARAKNSRSIWTTIEEKAIVAPNRPRDMILAQKLGRSVGAIQIKRSRIMA